MSQNGSREEDSALDHLVLVVDDSDVIRESLSEELNYAGYRVESTPDGGSVLLRLESGNIDLVILDIMMPVIDGFEVLARIRERYSTAELPVLMLSGLEGGPEVIRALRLGANDYVVKDGRSEEILERVRLALELKGPAGRLLGPFRIRKSLGSGGMGSVYAAYDTEHDRPVALKILSRELAISPQMLGRFQREARLAAAMDHPNVVRCYGAGEAGSATYLAMELIEGTNLSGLDIGPSEVVKIGRQIAEGLAALHRAGIIHRDIKPDNILCDAEGRIKIVDLGIARELQGDNRLTGTGIGMGSLVFASPEQLGGKADERSDIYSLGSTIYLLLTRREPFDPYLPVPDLLRAKQDEPPAVRDAAPAVTEALATLVERMMAPQPDARPATCEEVIAALDNIEPQAATL